MLASSIIARKRDSFELTSNEIQFMIDGMLDGSVPDYQISAWAMAILCRGMSPAEVNALTECMLDSGKRLRRVSERPRVDKHSTGGLGDKVSLILAPLLACFELDVPMLSGRGLGITGGTLDKLEAYPGFRCDLTNDEIEAQLNQIGCVITGTTPEITPADRYLYGLRDVTGTVPSIALITASILSKKLAESLDALVLDVKVGSGAFMKTIEEARSLAGSLASTSESMGLSTRAVLSDMNQPLGAMVGNACEANESVETLRGEGPADVRQLTLRLAGELLVQTGRSSTLASAEDALADVLDQGTAFDKFVRMVEAQAGQFHERLPVAKAYSCTAKSGGWIAAIDGNLIGQAVIALGGGRRLMGEKIDPAVGIEMRCRVGDQVDQAQELATVFSRSQKDFDEANRLVSSAILVADQPQSALELFLG